MEFHNGAICPVCEIGKLTENKTALSFEYKGVERIIDGQTVFECSVCNESFMNKGEQREVDKMLINSRREIDGLLTTNQIKSIRTMFGLTQVEFSKLLQVGEKNFARYENGQATQGRMTDNLLRVLQKYPIAIKTFGIQWPKAERENIFDLRAYYHKSIEQSPKAKIISEACSVNS